MYQYSVVCKGHNGFVNVTLEEKFRGTDRNLLTHLSGRLQKIETYHVETVGFTTL